MSMLPIPPGAPAITATPIYAQANSYIKGAVVIYTDANAYFANAAIPANTAFAIGYSGATWQVITGAVSTAWLLTNGYAAGESVMYTDGNSYMANNAIPASTAFVIGTTGQTWMQVTLNDWALANAYPLGAKAIWNDITITANAAISASTAVSLGTTGQTWAIDLVGTGGNWRGPWVTATAYAVNDVVSSTAATASFYKCISTIASSVSVPYSGSTTADTSKWQFLAVGANAAQDLLQAATATLAGAKGDVPAPAIGDHTSMLMGDGTWSKAVPIVTRFTGAGTFTWTPNAKMRFAIVECQAGGGGAGAPTNGASNNSYVGGSGSGGSYGKAMISQAQAGFVSGVPQPISITVGASGSSTAGQGAGGNGGTSSIGTYVSCPGGTGGQVSIAAAELVQVAANAPSDPTFSNCSIIETVTGQAGGASFSSNVLTSILSAGAGGSSRMGAGVGGATISRAVATEIGTNAGQGPGAGGGGIAGYVNTGARGGNAGVRGLVIIIEYL